MTLASRFAYPVVIKSGKRYWDPAWKHIRSHWAKYASGAFAVDAVVDATDMITDIKNMDSKITGDDAELIRSEIGGILDDLSDNDDMLIPEKIQLGLETPNYYVANLQTGKSWLMNKYISGSYVSAIKRNTVPRRTQYRRKR